MLRSQRRKPHRGCNAAALIYGAHTGAIAEMGNDNFFSASHTNTHREVRLKEVIQLQWFD
jgi:hypothetical protein